MMNLEELGFTIEELRERVIERIADRLLSAEGFDEDGDPTRRESKFRGEIAELVRNEIDEMIVALGEKHVLPNIRAYVENLTLTETNKWGEKQGASVTFIEYLVKRAEAYMTEEVDWNGKTRAQEHGSYFTPQGTRIAYLIHEHLHHSIEQAMKKALEEANRSIVEGLKKTVEMKLAEISKAMKVELKTR